MTSAKMGDRKYLVSTFYHVNEVWLQIIDFFLIFYFAKVMSFLLKQYSPRTWASWLFGIWIDVMGKNTLSPPKLIVANIIFLHFVVLVKYGNHILDFFAYFNDNIWLTLNLN
jgi:hypothetical protein